MAGNRRGFAVHLVLSICRCRTRCRDAQVPSGPPKLVVFGGRGYVGSYICKEALNTGLGVLSISKSGKWALQPHAGWQRGSQQ